MEFRGEKHRQIFQNYIRRKRHRPSAHHLAAVYLLTADKTLWKQVRGVFRDGKADLSAVHLCGIQPDAYAKGATSSCSMPMRKRFWRRSGRGYTATAA